MSIIPSIKKLNMVVDEKYQKGPLNESLNLYHELVERKIIIPRENQLNHSGLTPQIIHFNQNK